MWFVWDGRIRLGPYSEQEICRRTLGGEWPLAVYVRPEKSSVYRPLTWMLPAWTLTRSEVEQDWASPMASMHDATQVRAIPAPEMLGNMNSPSITVRAKQKIINDNAAVQALQPPPLPPEPPSEFPVFSAKNPSDKNKGAASAAKDSRKPAHGGADASSGKKEEIAKNDDFNFLTTELAGPAERRSEVKFEKISNKDATSDGTLPLGSLPVKGSQSRTKTPARSADAPGEPKEQSTDVSAAIAAGERETRDFNDHKDGRSKGNTAYEPTQLMLERPRKGSRSSVQSPAIASEGSVSLVDTESATQIKFRRVNPTAPRRRGRNAFDKVGLSSIAQAIRKSTRAKNNELRFPTIALAILAMVGFAGWSFSLFFNSKPSAPPAPPETELAIEKQEPKKRKVKKPRPREENSGDSQTLGQSERKSEPTQERNLRRPTESRNAGAESRNFKPKTDFSPERPVRQFNARPLPTTRPSPPPAPRNVQPKAKVFSSFADLNRYLTGGGPRGFIVVGPITLVKKPPDACGPCLGTGTLSDGTLINLSSVQAVPWNSVRGRNVVYARGFLTASGKMNLTVNTMSQNPF